MHISQILAQKAETSPIQVIKPGMIITPDQVKALISFVRERSLATNEGDWALIGGLAMQWHGCPRMTGNCDVVVDRPLGFPTLKLQPGTDYCGDKWVAPDGARLTVINRQDEYKGLYRDALLCALESGKGVHVVRPEHLAVMKFAVQTREQDLDVRWLLKREALTDRDKALDLVKEHLGKFAATAFQKAIQEADCDLEQNGPPDRWDYP